MVCFTGFVLLLSTDPVPTQDVSFSFMPSELNFSLFWRILWCWHLLGWAIFTSWGSCLTDISANVLMLPLWWRFWMGWLESLKGPVYFKLKQEVTNEIGWIMWVCAFRWKNLPKVTLEYLHQRQTHRPSLFKLKSSLGCFHSNIVLPNYFLLLLR